MNKKLIGILLFVLFMTYQVMGLSIKKMPEVIEFESFNLVKVSPVFNQKDYTALMSAKSYIHERLGADDWPSDSFTAEQNLETLINDVTLFNSGKNYTFHIFNPSNKRIVGCIYITPNYGDEGQLSFSSFYWLIPALQDSELSMTVESLVSNWLIDFWEIEIVSFDLN
jgi:hypothetical protein